MIEKELAEIRELVNRVENGAGPPRDVGLAELQEAMRPVLTALEKLAGAIQPKQTAPIEWRDPEGDLWWWDEESLAMRWQNELRRIIDGHVAGWTSMTGEWQQFSVPEAYDSFYRRMWAHFTGEQT